MKKTATWLAALCAALLALPVMGCKDEQNSVAVESVALNTTTLTLAPGGTGKLTATVVPSDADDRTVKWLSSDETVVIVGSDGTVWAIKTGFATITAQAGSKTAVCLVTVKQEAVAVESVTLSTETLTLVRGTTRKLTATVLPDNADDRTVAWSSSNADVATVGTDGTVGAIKPGTATITARAGDKEAACTVTVKPVLIAVESVELDMTTLTLASGGGTRKMTATVLPSNADDTAVAWSSSDETVATVSSDGTVTAHAEGTATITAQAGDKEAACEVTVKSILIPVREVYLDKEIMLYPGKTWPLTLVVLPNNADDKTVTWSSSNADIVTVDDDGIITAVKPGTATVTATTREGGKTAACTVTVGVEVERVTFNTETLSLAPGETGKLTVTITPDDATHKAVIWHSSDKSVVTVDDDGTVTAHTEGREFIEALATGGNSPKWARCWVTVKRILIAVENVTLDAATLTLVPGGTGKLTATVTPSNADDKTVAWSSSDTSVATVGSDGTVTAVKAGTATITATAQTGGKTAECTVTVNGVTENPIPVAVEQVTLDATTLTLTRGGTGKLTATVTPSDADDKTVAWLSSDTSVATVGSDGTVTAVKAGTATITARAGGKTATCVATVNPIAVERVTLNTTTLALARGTTGKLTATVTPDNADDTTVIWSSSDPAVATVDNDGAVTAHAAGTATITATAKTGGKTAGCTVTVNPIRVDSVMLSMTTLTLTRGETRKLTATVTPSNADDTAVAWSSSDTSVATVGSDGTVTAVKAGTATITAQAGGKTATCEVTVNPVAVVNVTLDATTLTLTCGETGKLSATITPSNADDKTVAWSSSNADVATVGSDGTVTAVKAGTATVTARAGGKEATCAVTVKQAVEDVALNKTTLTLVRGMTEKLTATVLPNDADDKTIAWSSSNETVATVDNDGTVTAVKAGTATITARAGGKTATCEVTVNPVAVENVTLDATTLTLASGETKKLTATVTPSNADDKTVAWSSSNRTVATVGNDGTVTAVAKGTATITAKAGGKTAECMVTVHDHSYSGGKCTICGSKPYMKDGTIDDRGVLTKYSGSESTVVIPDGVTGIGDSAFSGCTKLKSVTIPSGVTGIGDSAFSGCTNLTGVAIPDGVTGIGDSAFSKCTGLKSVTIPDSVTSIGDSAFSGCTKLEIVTIPNSVTSIGDSAFSGCTELWSVTIPSGVTSIGDSVFSGCRSLDSVTIPDSVTSIGRGAFSGCTGLTSMTIPDSVTSIGDSAFSGCTKLSSVAIPDSVTSIGDRAFYGCEKLKGVTIPDSVTSIGDSAFWGCRGLMSVTIPDSVTSIGDRAFSGCTILTSVTIPDSVTSIGKYAFEWCDYLTNVTIPDSVTSIGDCAFFECPRLTNVKIPASVTSIGNGMFCNCTYLKIVTIPASVTSIGVQAFRLCTYLTTINYTGTKEQWNAITKDSSWDGYAGSYTTAGSYTITYNYNE